MFFKKTKIHGSESFTIFKEIFSHLDEGIRLRIFSSFILGIFQFLLETFFIIVIQGFFISTGLIAFSKGVLPNWYPISIGANYSLILCYGALKGVIYFFKNFILTSTYQRFISTMRLRIFSLVLNPSFKEPHHIVYSVFSEQVVRSGAIINDIIYILMSLITSLALFIYCFKIAMYETIIGVLIIGFFHLILSKFGTWVGDIGNELNEHWENINYSMKNAIKNSFFINIKSKSDQVYIHSRDHLNQYEKSIQSYYFWNSLRGAAPQVLGIIILVILTQLSLRHFHTEKFVLITFLYLFLRFVQAVNETYVWFLDLRFNFPSYQSLMRLVELDIKKENAKKIIQSVSEIDFKNVSFSYENGEPVISAMNLYLQKGDIFVVTGESGTGKSTLIKLISGMIPPTSGEIVINDEPFNSTQFTIGKTISYSGPEPFMINGSLKENLAYSSVQETFDQERATQLLIQFGIWENFSSRDGFETIVKDFQNFSTGQLQRISLVRSLLQHADLLILDEATSNLDVATEKKVIEEIVKSAGERITIISTHRLAFLDIATKKMHLGLS